MLRRYLVIFEAVNVACGSSLNVGTCDGLIKAVQELASSQKEAILATALRIGDDNDVKTERNRLADEPMKWREALSSVKKGRHDCDLILTRIELKHLHWLEKELTDRVRQAEVKYLGTRIFQALGGTVHESKYVSLASELDNVVAAGGALPISAELVAELHRRAKRTYFDDSSTIRLQKTDAYIERKLVNQKVREIYASDSLPSLDTLFGAALARIESICGPELIDTWPACSESKQMLTEAYNIRRSQLLPVKMGVTGLGNFDSRDFSHIVIIPDVHGDADFFLKSLWTAFSKVEPAGHGVTEAQFESRIRRIAQAIQFPSGTCTLKKILAPLSRLGKKVAIVQLGDLMDRGAQSLVSYKVLASIEMAIGWKLIKIAGNHDLMIYNPLLPGGFDLRYNQDPTDISNDDAKILFGPGGPLSTFITQGDLIVARIGGPRVADYVIDPKSADTLFVHAGLDLLWAKEFLKEIGKGNQYEELVTLVNEHFREAFAKDLASASQLANTGDGPVFVRKVPLAVDQEVMRQCVLLETLLTKLQVSRVIVGHTPDAAHATREYCDSRFIITDVGMSRGLTVDGQPYAMIMTLDNKGQQIRSLVAHYNHPNPSGLRYDQVLIHSP
jgi:hypothetical protein